MISSIACRDFAILSPLPLPRFYFFRAPFYFAPLPTIWTPGTGKSMSSMAKLKDGRSCFITRWRVFYKCVQLVQGEIMLISITITLLLNLEKNISYVFLFLRNFQISFPSVFTVTLFCFREKSGEKTLQLTSINFVYMRLPDLRRIARIAMARCTWEAKFEAIQRHYIKIYQSNFLLCYIKFIPL